MLPVVAPTAARKNPRKYSRIFHVKGHRAYAIENSNVGIVLALFARFLWIDIDGHVTRDKHTVCCHWNFILKDHFILPGWFIQKYGHNPKVSNVDLEDLLKLESHPIKYGRRTYKVRYHTIGQMARLIADCSTTLGMAFEPKGDSEFETVAMWKQNYQAVQFNGLPLSRMLVMTLQNIGNPWKRLIAAREARPTIYPRTILLARGRGIPVGRKFDFDYVRGRMRWI